jgi:hypothetical protein
VGNISLDELLTLKGIDRDAEYPQECCGRMKKWGSWEGFTERVCINGYCTELYCECGKLDVSWGPIGCHCEFGGPNPLCIDGHAYRRRRRNR